MSQSASRSSSRRICCPALVRAHGWRVRGVGALPWIGCIAATCYGHAVFFLMAQKNAGELRAAAVPVVTAHGRDLSMIVRDRADAVTRLARATARRCVEPWTSPHADRTARSAHVETLDVEKAEALRAEAAQDRASAERAAALADPLTGAPVRLRRGRTGRRTRDRSRHCRRARSRRVLLLVARAAPRRCD